MRSIADSAKISKFMQVLGRDADREAKIYFVGGATAVLIGWRKTTIDVDIKIVPESDALLQAIPRIKETLDINVEFSAPDQFIPALSGWEERSPSIEQQGRITYYHYDFYSQALAKIQRGHQQDLDDVRALFKRNLVESRKLMEHFQEIERKLYRFPAIDPKTFRSSVEDFLRSN